MRGTVLALAVAATGVCSVTRVVAFTGMAWAQAHGGHGEFDRLVRSAIAHYEAHEARAAIADLERAFAIRPLPRLLYNLGRAHEQAGEWVAAADYYQRFLQSRPDGEAEAVTREALDVARRHIAEQQALEAQRTSDAVRQRDLELARQQALADAQRQSALRPGGRGPDAPVGPRRVTPLMLGLWTGAGVAAVAGGVLGGLALREAGDFPDVRQGAARGDLVTRGTAFAWASNASIATAVVAGVVGLILYLTQSPTAGAAP